MLTLVNIYDHIFTRVNKDQSGNTYRLDQFNTDLSVANTEMFSWLYGLPQEYKPGMPIPAMAFEVTQRILDDLKQCKVNMGGYGTNDPSPLNVVEGIAQIPSDYVHFVRMNYVQVSSNKCKAPEGKVNRKIEILTDAQWADRVGNYVKNKKVDQYPYCNFQREYIEFRPFWKQQFVNFVYLRMPKTPFLDYVINPDGSTIFLNPGQVYVLQPGQVYRTGQLTGFVSSQTVELEWSEEVKPEIANIILGYIADNLREPFLKQSGEMRKKQGV